MRIRIRSAQLRGFASLSLLRLGQTARRQTLRHLPYVRKRKQPAKNAGASLRFAPSGVFFCSLRASGFGFGSGRFARSALVLSGWLRCAVSFGVLSFRRFLWLLWLASAVRVLCRRRFRRWFRRAFRRLFLPVAALRLVVLPALTVSLCRRLAVWARRFLCFRLRRLVLGAVRLRGVRRLWFRRFPLPVRVAVWLLLFRRLVRLVCFLRGRLRAASRVSVRVLGLRLLLPSVRAFRLSFFLAFRLAFLRCRFCPLGLVLGLRLVLAFGLPVFVLFLLRLLLCLSKPFLFLYLH